MRVVASVFVRSSHKPSPEEEYGEYLKSMTHYSGLYIDNNSNVGRLEGATCIVLAASSSQTTRSYSEPRKASLVADTCLDNKLQNVLTQRYIAAISV